MDQDVGLQRAIMASLRDTRPTLPRPAPVHRERLQPAQPQRNQITRISSSSSSGAGFGHRRSDLKPTVPIKKEPKTRTSAASGTRNESAPITSNDQKPTYGGASKSPPPPARKSGESKSSLPPVNNPVNGNKKQYPSHIDPKFAEIIEAEIISPTDVEAVQWEDVAGLERCKEILQEATILPIIAPELFEGMSSWKGVLLYGPPGTGKTLLAKAVATANKTTFFCMSASSLLSRYHGESEKLIKTLFALARHYAPSTIFFDEIDALMSTRGGGSGGEGQEVMRRVKAEMLQQIDGVGTSSAKPVVVIATTNTPWDLDEAMRRRLEKRIYVPLPEKQGRAQQIKHNTQKLPLSDDVEIDSISDATEGFSGADLSILCRDAAMMRLRRLTDGRSPMEMVEMKSKGLLNAESAGPITQQDFTTAIGKINPSVSSSELEKYVKWSDEFGSV